MSGKASMVNGTRAMLNGDEVVLNGNAVPDEADCGFGSAAWFYRHASLSFRVALAMSALLLISTATATDLFANLAGLEYKIVRLKHI